MSRPVDLMSWCEANRAEFGLVRNPRLEAETKATARRMPVRSRLSRLRAHVTTAEEHAPT